MTSYFCVYGCHSGSHKQDLCFDRAVLVLDASKVLPGCLFPNFFRFNNGAVGENQTGKTEHSAAAALLDWCPEGD